MSEPGQLPDPLLDEDEPLDAGPSGVRVIEITPDQAGGRLDKTLAEHAAELSRGRIQALMADGLITFDGAVVSDASSKAKAGLYTIAIPAPAPAEPRPEAIPLSVLFEDQHLIVIDKPAGMAAHPGPGTESGTLVNALLHHCAGSLSGIGGVARPGIVHRLDKDTSGVMVAAKTDAAHQGLSALFATHDIDRVYIALTRGAPYPAKGTIENQIGRSAGDRKKMAVLRTGGRRAVTHYAVEKLFGPGKRLGDPYQAARVSCQLQTGRTHQIRVHMASKGSPCLGDPAYGSGPPAQPVREAMATAGLARQALHAAVLGFVHPITGETMRFETPLPDDMRVLEELLGGL